MCGRFVQDDDLNTLLAAYALDSHLMPEFTPRWNIAPTQTIGLIRSVSHDDGTTRRVLGPARWSLTPPWEKTLTLRYSTINARAETVATTTTFRDALAHRRALIPTGGYYEWVSRGGTKTPHFVATTADTPLAFASVYSWWSGDKTAPPLCTATVLTNGAASHLSWLHPRAPVFVPPQWWERWLNPAELGNQDMVGELLTLQPTITASLTAHAVGPVKGDGPQLTAPRGT